MILSVCPNPSIDTYAWIDAIEAKKANRITALKEFPGGKATHIAFALNELHHPTTLFANWAGNSGQWIKQSCADKNINTDGIEVVGQNRKCYTFRSKNEAFNNTELLEPGPTFTEQDWKNFSLKFQDSITKYSLVCISGSWPKGAPNDAYAQLITICNHQQKKVIIDCSGEQLKHALQGSFFGLHINEDELKSVYDNSDISTIVKNLSKKIKLIAITKGKEGLWLYYQGKLIHANVSISKVISTVGSGDCLTAGIAYAVDKNLKIEEIASYGVACGAANCLNDDLGMLKIEDVNQLLPKVTLKELDYAS
ncbi:1-phosphofructokinase family hexose kinase [Joostella sp. CR20]|uniref:1-phosphofructokinase family hexose kinase n=1 Tax=Joostella sp. CR20 TaxID=2804312 RepID=UPI00313B5E7B